MDGGTSGGSAGRRGLGGLGQYEPWRTPSDKPKQDSPCVGVVGEAYAKP